MPNVFLFTYVRTATSYWCTGSFTPASVASPFLGSCSFVYESWNLLGNSQSYCVLWWQYLPSWNQNLYTGRVQMCRGGKYKFSKWSGSMVSRATLTVALGFWVNVFYSIKNQAIVIALWHILCPQWWCPILIGIFKTMPQLCHQMTVVLQHGSFWWHEMGPVDSMDMYVPTYSYFVIKHVP